MNDVAIVRMLLLVLIMPSSVHSQQNASFLAYHAIDDQSSRRSEDQHADYDPLEVISRFLLKAYPDLGEQQGASTLRVPFSGGSFNLASLEFEFHPCRWSGVSPQPSHLPYCGVPQEKSYLSANVTFGREKHRPILAFNASGIFIDSELQALREQFKDRVLAKSDLRDKKRYWMEEEALGALHARNPKYGPERKNEFLASLPINGLHDVTGCRLHPESAQFVVVLSTTLPPQLEWTVRGDEESLSQKEECWASFEPFAGRLTAMGN